MSNRIQNTLVGAGVAAVLLLGWARSSSPFRSAALATDAVRPARPASIDTSLCGCSGKAPVEETPVFSSDRVASPGEDLAETARMHRMSANILKPQLQLSPEAAISLRTEWAERFRKQSDPLLRQEIVTEMTQLDDGRTLDTMLGLFDNESDASVRDQIILIVGFMRATGQDMPKVCGVFGSAYDRGNAATERARMLDIISNVAAAESVAFMRHAFTSPRSSDEDRFNAAAGLFKLAQRVAVDAELMGTVTESLKQVAASSPSAKDRCRAAGVLAAAGQDNKAFFRTLLESEQDTDVRKFLDRAGSNTRRGDVAPKWVGQRSRVSAALRRGVAHS